MPPQKRGTFPTCKGVEGNNFRKNNAIITIEIPCKDDVHIVPTKHKYAYFFHKKKGLRAPHENKLRLTNNINL